MRAWAAIAALVLAVPADAWAREPARGASDAQIRQAIIEESIASYQASGRPCACPFNSARNGSSCGGRSAYSRPGGSVPLCYPQDVSDGMVAAWKAGRR